MGNFYFKYRKLQNKVFSRFGPPITTFKCNNKTIQVEAYSNKIQEIVI